DALVAPGVVNDKAITRADRGVHRTPIIIARLNDAIFLRLQLRRAFHRSADGRRPVVDATQRDADVPEKVILIAQTGVVARAQEAARDIDLHLLAEAVRETEANRHAAFVDQLRVSRHLAQAHNVR